MFLAAQQSRAQQLHPRGHRARQLLRIPATGPASHEGFQLRGSLSLYVRIDALNVFDWYNYADYKSDYGSRGTLPANPVTYNPTGNIIGVPRTFKAQLGMRF